MINGVCACGLILVGDWWDLPAGFCDACVFVCMCPSECFISGATRPRPPSMCGTDSSCLDTSGLPVVLCPVAPGASL